MAFDKTVFGQFGQTVFGQTAFGQMFQAKDVRSKKFGEMIFR
jgi:hypothetical protein